MTAEPDIFETDRLQVKRWSSILNDPAQRQDLVGELEPVLTPPVLHHLPPPLQLPPGPRAISDWITARDQESHVFTVRDRQSGNLLGLLILATFPQAPGPTIIHLGYLFTQSAWGQGFATELLTGLVQWCRGHAQSIELLGGVETTNPASAKVLEKAGFHRAPALSTDETDMYRLVL